MPCADGELCLVPANSPKDPDGHGCQGGCGGRLHGICGSIADDENENHRMCSACVVKAGKRKAKAAEGAETGQEQAGKRKAKAAEGAGTGQSKRPNTKGGVLSASRKRLTIQEKVQILQLLDKRTSHEHIADRFNCSDRLVRKVKAEREVVEKEAATGGGALKTKRRGDFPEVRHTPLLQHCFFFGSSCLLFFVVVFCIILVFLFVTSFFPFFPFIYFVCSAKSCWKYCCYCTAVIWFVCVHRIYSSTPVQNQFCTYFYLQSNNLQVQQYWTEQDCTVQYEVCLQKTPAVCTSKRETYFCFFCAL